MVTDRDGLNYLRAGIQQAERDLANLAADLRGTGAKDSAGKVEALAERLNVLYLVTGHTVFGVAPPLYGSRNPQMKKPSGKSN